MNILSLAQTQITNVQLNYFKQILKEETMIVVLVPTVPIPKQRFYHISLPCIGLGPVTISENANTYLLHFNLFKDTLQTANQHIGTHHLLTYAYDANLLGENIDAIQEHNGTFNEVSKRVCLEVNSEKIRYMLLCHRQNAGQNHDTKLEYVSFENVAQFKYLGMTVKK
jgi:hypothetical protein